MKKFEKVWSRLMILLMVLTAVVLVNADRSDAAKKSSYITNKKYIGTYGYNGNKGSLETGWYSLIINKISASGQVRFQLSKGGRNGSPLYETKPLTAKIKGNKASFTYDEDGWNNKGKGIIVFNKNGTVYLTVKETHHADFNRNTLATSKALWKKVSKKNKVNDGN